MFDLFKKKTQSSNPKPCRTHDYATVAFDSSFHTRYTDSNYKDEHHIKWLKCRVCGHRSFDRDGAYKHAGVEQVRNRWIENNMITLTDKGDVYHKHDYQVIDRGQNWKTYGFQPLIGVEQHLHNLENDSEFEKLLENQMVRDAFGQLQVAVKLHQGLDKSE